MIVCLNIKILEKEILHMHYEIRVKNQQVLKVIHGFHQSGIPLQSRLT